ncbi:MAG: carboxylesterase [Xanthomonadales bacterium]|nr:carboxylesterase [Xanthomonadales bacterium]MBK7146820.1 carboxylesterase [Xanthomonadales bacterium]MCC6561541.1 carboxylesterase [Xanthomonadales bacterium]
MDLLETVELETGPDPRFSVLWLHGLGADGHDFESVVPQLVRPEWPAIRFVFPHAPMRPVTVNGGMRMRAWYDISGTEIAHRQDETGIRQSMQQIDALLAREAARGIAPQRQFIAGFSQGGAITLSVLVRRRETLAGAIALSTYLPLADLAEHEWAEAATAIPLFMAHGSLDPVVPQGLGLMSREWLTRHGFKVDWHSYPMPHSVSMDEIRQLTQWIGERLRATA